MVKKYKPELAEQLLDLGKKGKYVTQVAAIFGVCRESLYQWSMDSNKPEFVEAWPLYKTFCQNWWMDLGVKGIMGEIPKWQYTPWIYMMKCLFREEWLSDQKQTHEVNTEGVKSLSDEQLEQMALDKVQNRIAKLRLIKNKS